MRIDSRPFSRGVALMLAENPAMGENSIDLVSTSNQVAAHFQTSVRLHPFTQIHWLMRGEFYLPGPEIEEDRYSRQDHRSSDQ